MFMFFLVFVGIGAFLTAGATAALARHLTGKDALALAFGTLTMPAIILALLAYWLATLEVDDAPPGMVILGNLAVIGVITPVALLASHLTIKFLGRRTLRNSG
ncbi:MAG: hypothetical protein KGQ52_10625 [Alphaproteobacteria bacterium]|nr:hypothetical protein [Alphaproteobacteria bacterium]